MTSLRHRWDAVKQFIKAFQTVDRILGCHHVPGKADFLLRVVALDIPHHGNFILEILGILPGIQLIESKVVLSTVKDSEVVPHSFSSQLIVRRYVYRG